MLSTEQYNTICDDIVSLLDICAKGNAIAARRLNERILQIGVDRKAALEQRDALLTRLRASNELLKRLAYPSIRDMELAKEAIAASFAAIKNAGGGK